MDLTEDCPLWILSSYSPTPDTPRQLFGGIHREQSYEELRLRHYQLAAAGQEQLAVREATEFYDSAKQQIQAALRDLNGAISYIIDGRNEHPNRIDICRESTRGRSHQPSTGVSNQILASLQGSTFGQASQFGQASAFGQQSTFGKPQNPFAATSSSQTPFGKTSQLGANRASAFMQPKNPFAENSGSLDPESRTTFSSGSARSGFAHPLSMQRSTTQPNEGGQWLRQDDATIAPANPFTGTQQPSSVQSLTNDHAFGGEFPSTSGFSRNKAGESSSTQKDAHGRLISWKGKQIFYVDEQPCYKRRDGNWERVWFTEPPKLDVKEQPPPSPYSVDLEHEYKYVQEHGAFLDGRMPDMPPRKEWCSWDF